MDNADPMARRQAYQEEVLIPLGRQKRFREICDWIVSTLETEDDPEFRFDLIPDLCLHLQMLGDNDACRHWATVLTKEFDDWPLAWTNIAIYGVGSDHSGPLNGEERKQKLAYYEIALDRAYKKDEWVRYTLFATCRQLTFMKEYGRLADRMREIIADLDNKREIDIPFLEADWLKRVPEGAIDEEVRRTYESYVQADAARRRVSVGEEGPTTRQELEKYFRA